ncbi:hypothetical protein LY76DRAFT_176775 [Colletotrichum caudatum]|nr:hypothetical protein LY76DRAFT_176775 [Colletotrichum caudatum]
MSWFQHGAGAGAKFDNTEAQCVPESSQARPCRGGLPGCPRAANLSSQQRRRGRAGHPSSPAAAQAERLWGFGTCITAHFPLLRVSGVHILTLLLLHIDARPHARTQSINFGLSGHGLSNPYVRPPFSLFSCHFRYTEGRRETPSLCIRSSPLHSLFPNDHCGLGPIWSSCRPLHDPVRRLPLSPRVSMFIPIPPSPGHP